MALALLTLLTGTAIVAWVAYSRGRPLEPAPPPSPEMLRRRRAWAAGWFWASAAGAAGVLFFAPWRKKTDFDMVGCLWLMENILFLVLLAVAVIGMAVSGGLWIESAKRR